MWAYLIDPKAFAAIILPFRWQVFRGAFLRRGLAVYLAVTRT